MAQITLDQIAHSFDPNPASDADYALKNIDYRWEDGGAYALLGPSGCGKTTLLNIISGLLTSSNGRVLYDNNDMTLLTPEQRNIAQVFQFPVIYDTMTVAENLAFPLVNRGVDRSEIDKRVAEMLQTLELADKANRRAQGLTADEKQKISLGRGLVRYDVSAILFDEPLTVIDPHMKWQLRTKLKSLHEQLGHTMIYVTHDQTEALTFADKVVVMLEGNVLQVGTPEELFDNPAHTFVGYFIGSPGMNIFPGTVSGKSLRLGSVDVQLSKGYSNLIGKTEIGIRPEFITLTSASMAGSQGMKFNLESIEDVGRQKIVRGNIEGMVVNVIVTEDSEIPSEPYAILDPERVCVFQDSFLVSGDS
ncbi:MAG: ABC transporter ATP-binding protein [Granulosicoccaceae bacterium]